VTAVAQATTLTLADVLTATGGRLTSRGDVPEVAFAGVSIDSRTIGEQELFVAIRGPRFDGHDFVKAAAVRGASAAVVQRTVEVPLPQVVVGDTTAALGALAHDMRRRFSIPVVGITGSVGKTTTKDMAAALLARRGPVLKTEGNLNNQWGLPLTLLRLRETHEAAVLEMGMSTPGESQALSQIAEPDVAVITRVAPVHLEFFESVDAVAAAKAEILEGLRPGGTAVLNGDDPRLKAIGEAWNRKVVWFGRDRRFDVSYDRWRGTVFGMRFDMRLGGRTVEVALPLAGPHFAANFVAAAAAAHVLGVDVDAMVEGAAGMAAARHRGEVRRLAGGVTLIDDCYNSSPEALDASLVTLTLAPARRRVAILGDMLELGDEAAARHRQSGMDLAGRVDALFAVGPLAKELVVGARDAGLPAEAVAHFDDAAAAAAAIPQLVKPGDAVLVKASRGLGLEVVVETLVRHLGEEETA